MASSSRPYNNKIEDYVGDAKKLTIFMKYKDLELMDLILVDL